VDDLLIPAKEDIDAALNLIEELHHDGRHTLADAIANVAHYALLSRALPGRHVIAEGASIIRNSNN